MAIHLWACSHSLRAPPSLEKSAHSLSASSACTASEEQRENGHAIFIHCISSTVDRLSFIQHSVTAVSFGHLQDMPKSCYTHMRACARVCVLHRWGCRTRSSRTGIVGARPTCGCGSCWQTSGLLPGARGAARPARTPPRSSPERRPHLNDSLHLVF